MQQAADFDFNEASFEEADEVIEYKLQKINKKIEDSMNRSVV
jgi:hypothetical protein